jgi:putative transposase
MVCPPLGTAAACDALGVSRASVYRQRQPPRPPAARLPPSRALAADERQTILDTLHSERFLDQAPAQVHATLLDEGRYLCSPRTMYRLLDAAGEIKRTAGSGAAPALRRPRTPGDAPQ